jgi:hypothetical protein
MNNKDIIKQYVNTGVSIPEYQFNKLNSGFKKSYLRARTIAIKETPECQKYEYNLFDKETQRIIMDYISKGIEENWDISDKEFEWCSDELKYKYISMRIEKNCDISDKQFELCSNELKHKYISSRIKNNRDISDKQFKLCSDELKEKYISMCIENDYAISDEKFELCSNELKHKYIKWCIEKGWYISYKMKDWYQKFKNKKS